MKRKVCLALLVPTLAATAVLAATKDRWLHVRVQERSGDETVSVNLPLEMVEKILPLIEVDEFQRGKVRLDDDDLEGLDLRAVLQALRDAPDAEFVTVQSRDETVRVAKEGGYLLVRAEEADDSEKVRVRVPLDVVEALLSGEPNELNVLAAVQALGEYTEGDLVTVEDGDTTVRVWIDFSQSGQ